MSPSPDMELAPWGSAFGFEANQKNEELYSVLGTRLTMMTILMVMLRIAATSIRIKEQIITNDNK